MCCDVVARAGLGEAAIPECVGGLFVAVIWLRRRTLGVPVRSTRSRRKIRTYSENDAVSAVVRDLGVGGGADGSWHVVIDVVESSAEESASELSIGLRESGVVSTGRSAVSLDSLEVRR